MNKNLLSIIISGILLLGINSSSYAADREFTPPIEEDFEYKTSNKAPEGFEDIINSTTYGFIDIYFANKYLGSFQSEYNYNNITFFENELIFELLNKEVTFINPNIVKETLKNPLPLNTEFNCNNNSVCEDFVPQVVGVVFDETTLSAKVYLNYNEIKEKKIDYNTLLAPSTSENSAIQSLDLSFFGGTEQDQTSYSLSGGTYLAHKEHRIKSNWIKSQDDFYFNQLYYGTDLDGYKIKTGYMTSNSFGYTFTPTFRMLGFEYGTSINTRKDLQTEFSEPLHVFLNQRAAVKITRGSELIYTAYHDAGNQIISTQNFPSGSYNVKVEIIEDNGSTRVINKFFVKSLSIPPEGESIFYINGGFMEKENVIQDQYLDFLNLNNGNTSTFEQNSTPILPNTESDPFVKFGYSNRFNDQTALYNELLYKESDYLYNPTVYFLGNGYDLKTSFIYGSNNAQGLTFDVNVPLDKHNFSLFGRYVAANNNSLVYGDGTSITASYNVNLEKYGSVSLFTSYDKSSTNDSKNITHSLGYRKNIYQDPSGSLNFNFDASKNNDETFFNLGFTYYFNGKDNWSFKTSPSFQKNGSTEDYRLNNSLRVSGDNSKQTQWHANLNTNNSKYSQNVFLNSSISDQRYGTATIDVNHDYTDSSKTTYIGNITTNIVSDSNNIAVGGKRRLESGIIIDLTKYEKEDDFELFVNDISTDYVKSGKETFIPLVPYKEYNMYLKSKSTDNFVQVTRKQNWVVPYPGNVQSLNWDINRISILSSQLIDEFGNIVVSQPIYVDSNKTYTDEIGYFQMEVISSDKVLWANIKDKKCSVDLTELMVEDIVYKDELICYYDGSVTEQDVQPEIKDDFIIHTIAGVPQKNIIDSINGTSIDINKIQSIKVENQDKVLKTANINKIAKEKILPYKENIIPKNTIIENVNNNVINSSDSCYSPYNSEKYVIKSGDTLSNIVRRKVLGKDAPYLEISSIINEISKCNNLNNLNELIINNTIVIPNLVQNPKMNSIKEVKEKIVIEKNNSTVKIDNIDTSKSSPIVSNIGNKRKLVLPNIIHKNKSECYVTKKGDYLYKIASEFMLPDSSFKELTKMVNIIAKHNNILNPDLISIGQEICIPDQTINHKRVSIKTVKPKIELISTKIEHKCYVAKKGDYLYKIASEFMPTNSSFKELTKMVNIIAKHNNILNPDLISIGQEIFIPDQTIDYKNIYYNNENMINIIIKNKNFIIDKICVPDYTH